jgi:hypothetical protein
MAESGLIVFMRTVLDKPLHRALTIPLPYRKPDGTMGLIPAGFESDGSSVPWIFQGFFPRHRHPIAFFRHDWRCQMAKTPAERLFADQEFRKDVRRTSWWITAWAGYAGVRVGAWLGVGVYNY